MMIMRRRRKEGNDIFDDQGNHGSAVANSMYRVWTEFLAELTPKLMDKFFASVKDGVDSSNSNQRASQIRSNDLSDTM